MNTKGHNGLNVFIAKRRGVAHLCFGLQLVALVQILRAEPNERTLGSGLDPGFSCGVPSFFCLPPVESYELQR